MAMNAFAHVKRCNLLFAVEFSFLFAIHLLIFLLLLSFCFPSNIRWNTFVCLWRKFRSWSYVSISFVLSDMRFGIVERIFILWFVSMAWCFFSLSLDITWKWCCMLWMCSKRDGIHESEAIESREHNHCHHHHSHVAFVILFFWLQSL